MIGFVCFIVSLVLLLLVQARASKEVVAPIFQYAAFSLIYVIFPFLYMNFDIEIVDIHLKNLTVAYVDTFVVLMLLINVQLLMFCGFHRFRERLIVPDVSVTDSISLLSSAYWLFYPVALMLVFLFPWPKFGEETTFFHSIATMAKTLLLLMFMSVCCVCRNRAQHGGLLIKFFALCFLMFVDTARTQLFFGLFALLYAYRFSLRDLIRYAVFVCTFFIFFVYMTLERTGIEFSFSLLLWPFYSEAIFGTYSLMNVLAMIEAGVWEDWLPLYFFIDLSSQTLFESLFEILEVGNSYSVVEKAASAGVIEGHLAPLGGHFFLAEMAYYFGFASTIVFSLLLLLYLTLLRKSKGVFQIYLLTTFFLVVKAPMFVVINNLLVVIVFVTLACFVVQSIRRYRCRGYEEGRV